MEVFKKCCGGAPGCEGKYEMNLRREAIKYDVYAEPPRADFCDNPACQAITKPPKKKHGHKPKD